MLEMELCTQFGASEMISCSAMANAFGCISTYTDISFIYNCTATYSLVCVLRLFDIFANGLQMDHLNGFQLTCSSSTLILHLIIQLILCLFILNCNTIKLNRYIGGVLEQAVIIGLCECCCIDNTYSKKLIYNIHGYSIDSYIIYGGKTVSIIKNRNKTKMQENDSGTNSIVKLRHNQLFNVSFNLYVILLRIILYDNLLPTYAAKKACMNGGSIVIKKNINTILQNVMDYLHGGWFNLFGLLKRNCINILIIFIGFANTGATKYLIKIGEYNLMCFIRLVVFEVNGDKQIILLQKKTEKNETSL